MREKLKECYITCFTTRNRGETDCGTRRVLKITVKHEQIAGGHQRDRETVDLINQIISID